MAFVLPEPSPLSHLHSNRIVSKEEGKNEYLVDNCNLCGTHKSYKLPEGFFALVKDFRYSQNWKQVSISMVKLFNSKQEYSQVAGSPGKSKNSSGWIKVRKCWCFFLSSHLSWVGSTLNIISNNINICYLHHSLPYKAHSRSRPHLLLFTHSGMGWMVLSPMCGWRR